MKNLFPGHFRPTENEFKALWENAIFVFDTNILLNLYRYSENTRNALEKAIVSIKDKSWLTSQIAKEYLNNSLSVTSGQAKEYDETIKTLETLNQSLSNTKRHPFLPEEQTKEFQSFVNKTIEELEKQKNILTDKLQDDEILAFVSETFDSKISHPYTESELNAIYQEGEERYQRDIPPGFKDGKKNKSGDLHRKFGDLILWKQMIKLAKEVQKPIIFVTDDRKEDWWLEHAGKTLGPRPELIEEFQRETQQKFYMYTADKFLSIISKTTKENISEEVFQEIQDLFSQKLKQELLKSLQNDNEEEEKSELKIITEAELLDELKIYSNEYITDNNSYIGLKHFVRNYLGSKGYEYNHSYGIINSLIDKGVLDIYKIDMGNYEVTAIKQNDN